MKSVGIKQLKARLSEYVRMARGGELILVTDRDEVVAQLGPARQQPTEPGSLDDHLERLAERGDLTRSRHPKRGWSWSPRSLGLPSDTAEGLLEELRRDR